MSSRFRDSRINGFRRSARLSMYASCPGCATEWIEHCNPVKLKEYLALGKPVVSTPFPELRRAESLCVEAVGVEDFAAAIDRYCATTTRRTGKSVGSGRRTTPGTPSSIKWSIAERQRNPKRWLRRNFPITAITT